MIMETFLAPICNAKVHPSAAWFCSNTGDSVRFGQGLSSLGERSAVFIERFEWKKYLVKMIRI